jgi:siroheme synthase (precorrin-2 oxidase/ferrochelatase)
MAFSFPVSLDVTGRRCVVFGSGPMATARAEALLDAGAHVTVIARPHEDGDLAGVFLAVAATGDAAEHARIFAEAEREGVLLNAVDNPAHCHFAVPAVLRRGDLVVAVSTGGRVPGFAARVRDVVARVIGPEYGPLLDQIAEARAQRRAAPLDYEPKEAVA